MAIGPQGKLKTIIAASTNHIAPASGSTSNRRCNTKAVTLAASHAFSNFVLHTKRITKTSTSQNGSSRR